MLHLRQLMVKCTGPPDAGNPHVRWDEGGDGGCSWHTENLATKGKPGYGCTRSLPTAVPRYSTALR